MEFLCMPEHLPLRRATIHSPLTRIVLLPSGPSKTVGSRIAYFQAQCPCLICTCQRFKCTLTGASHDSVSRWLAIPFLTTLSFATPCRFIPTLSARLDL